MRALAKTTGVAALLALASPARADRYQDYVSLCNDEVVHGHILSDDIDHEIVIEIPAGAILHLGRAKVCKIQRGASDVWRPVPVGMRQERRRSLRVAAIVFGSFAAGALTAGIVLLAPLTHGTSKYWWLQRQPPPDAAHVSAGGALAGVGLAFGIVAAALVGASF